MRILFVNDFKVRGGAEVFVKQFSGCMKSRGHDTYFAFSEGKHDGVRNFKVNRSRGALIRDKVIYWNVVDDKAKKSFREIVEALKPDLIHLNNLMLLTLAPLVVANELGIPRVVSVHDYWPVCPKRNLLRHDGDICSKRSWGECFNCVRKAYPSRNIRIIAALFPHLGTKMIRQNMNRCASFLKDETLVCSSNYVKEILVRFGYKSGNIHIIPYGVDTKIFRPCYRSSLTVLWVGRVVPPKGVEYFFEAAKIIKERHPEVRFLIVGETPKRAMYTYKKIPSSKFVEMVGKLPRKELRDVYSRSRVVVLTSIWPEPFGLVALEAMACGKPVIAFGSGGLREIIKDYENGFLVTLKNSRDLAEKITMLLGDEELAIAMGRRARKIVEEQYRIEKMYERYGELYRKLLS